MKPRTGKLIWSFTYSQMPCCISVFLKESVRCLKRKENRGNSLGRMTSLSWLKEGTGEAGPEELLVEWNCWTWRGAREGTLSTGQWLSSGYAPEGQLIGAGLKPKQHSSQVKETYLKTAYWLLCPLASWMTRVKTFTLRGHTHIASHSSGSQISICVSAVREMCCHWCESQVALVQS